MPQFRSIRRRLVAGFTLLTLLTVSLLGVLVFGLMQRHIVRQEQGYLQQNATAIAQQSALLLAVPLPPAELASLARTAALLGNFRVKILDAEEEVLVDSALPPTRDHIISNTLLRRMIRPGEATWDEDVFIIEASGHDLTRNERAVAPSMLRWREAHGQRRLDGVRAVTRESSIPYEIRVFRRNQGEWGPLLRFERAPIPLANITVTEQFTATLDAPVTSPPQTPPPQTTDVEIGTSSVQRVVTPIYADDTLVGYVELSSQSGVAGEALAALRRLFLLVGSAVSCVAVGVGLIMSRSLTAPLQTLTEATQRMNDGDLAARAAVQSNDEIGLLASAFNRMAAALEKNFADLAAERDALRTFIGDASHELRTPITALRTFNDLLQDSAAHDPAAQAEFLAESGLQLRRLERITENLLNLSRLDSGLTALTLEEVQIGELITRVGEMVRPLATERAITLTVEPPPALLTIRCDRHQIESALVNLVENAIKFTAANGIVVVGAKAEQINGEAGVSIWVKDTGVGITPTEQPHIFRRFYRGQQATNGGSGLGLAIVQSVMHAHGGSVTVESVAGQGSRFTLYLPLL